MLVRSIRLSLAPMSLSRLGGCTTYNAPRPAFAYYAVPCSTPGAFVAKPIEDIIPTKSTQASPPAPSRPAASLEETSKASSQTCMIPISIRQARSSARYDGSGYFDPYRYGPSARLYGSLGIGLHGGGHGWRPYAGHGNGHNAGHGGGSHGGHGNH